MMLPRHPKRVFLAVGNTDMRKSINGLAVTVERAMGHNPFSGDLFVFCNRRRNMIKILYWDKNGFALWHKRLEKHRFHWPTTTDEVISLSTKELEWLLAGLDFMRAHVQLHYRFAS
jgi:transposase